MNHIILTFIVAGAALAGVAVQGQEGFREPDLEGPFRVRVDRVIEGDHFELDFRNGPRRGRQRMRLVNVNTPSPHADKECERALGIEVRDYVRQFVRRKTARVHNLRTRGRDRFAMAGRLELDGEDLGQNLFAAGLAVPYNDSPRNPEPRTWPCEDEAAAN